MSVPPSELAVDLLLLMEDYQGSFTDAYRADPALGSLPYDACAQRLFSQQIYYGDAYVTALTSHGVFADQVVPLCRPLQFKWARDHGLRNPSEWATRVPLNTAPVRFAKQVTERQVLSRILLKQIARLRPKIVWLFSGIPVTAREIRTWRRHAEHVILWWSSPLRPGFPYTEFDLILTGIPSLVSHFERWGIRTEYLPHAFDSRVLTRVASHEQRILKVAFVGSLSRGHSGRIGFLDSLARRVPVDFYGHGRNLLPADSPLRQSFRGSAWGDQLYSIYGSYLIVVHRNIDVAGASASAKRLFEATGMGACVVTENSDSLPSLFTPDVEIVTYADLQECAAKIESLLSHPEKARSIGRNGQARTLRDHTYDQRIRTLLNDLKDAKLL